MRTTLFSRTGQLTEGTIDNLVERSRSVVKQTPVLLMFVVRPLPDSARRLP